MSKVSEKFPSTTPEHEGFLPYTYVEENVKHLSGEILTIIDSAIVNEKQNKAVKDQIKDRIKENIYGFQFYAFTQVGKIQSQGHSI